jgi:protein-L-isoaspartate(D-aspartate) O-methyltransferase
VTGAANEWRNQAHALADALARDGIEPRIAEAIARVPRHLFVPDDLRDRAYEDNALPIGREQTISQPFVVAYMTALLEVTVGDRVLEIGTGSGYQTAVLAELGADVFSVEIIEELSVRAAHALAAAGYSSVRLRVGDGAEGWPEHAPYDAIIVTAAAMEPPPRLIEQLATGGRMGIPLEDEESLQWIWRIRKRADGSLAHERMLAVRFVPMTGHAQLD